MLCLKPNSDFVSSPPLLCLWPLSMPKKAPIGDTPPKNLILFIYSTEESLYGLHLNGSLRCLTGHTFSGSFNISRCTRHIFADRPAGSPAKLPVPKPWQCFARFLTSKCVWFFRGCPPPSLVHRPLCEVVGPKLFGNWLVGGQGGEGVPPLWASPAGSNAGPTSVPPPPAHHCFTVPAFLNQLFLIKFCFFLHLSPPGLFLIIVPLPTRYTMRLPREGGTLLGRGLFFIWLYGPPLKGLI